MKYAHKCRILSNPCKPSVGLLTDKNKLSDFWMSEHCFG